MERVTVQFNGEMVTMDVPEGMSDEQIFSFLQQQDANKPSQMASTQTQPSLGGVAEQVAGQSATKAALYNPQMSVTSPAGPIKPTAINPTLGNAVLQEAVDLTKIAGQVSPAGVRSFVESPSKILQIPGAFLERYIGSSNMNKNVGDVVKGAGRALTNPSNYLNAAKAVGGAVMAPENILAAPYTMAGYEQEKIRQNPTAPEYEFNPYAQMTRGQAATQGQAGAMNTRNALANQQYGSSAPPSYGGGFVRDMNFGGLTAEQQQMLEQDKIDQAIRRKAAQKVLGPVIPQGR